VSNGQGGSITSNPAALFVNPIPPTRQPRPTPGFEGFDPAISALGFLVPREIGVDGEQLEWVITVTNRGSASGSELIITDTLRDGLRIDRVDVAAGSASISGQTVTVAIPALAPGSSVRFSIFTTVITGGPEANNTTCVTAANISAQTCTRALAVRTLPTTGETPYWRALLLMASLVGALFVIIGAGLVTSAGGTQDK
jgi:uncharacterized repeat protein (TIGR01451 family)